MIGRYHKPVAEERIFLFLDVVGSTAFAEAHGDLRAQEYLGAVFATLAEPVRRNGGSVDDYVGDLAMVTWPISRGLKDARCVTCLFDVLDRIEADAAAWTTRFGTVPRLRAALHGGSVVTAEVGVDRHKIAYFGDAVNVTSRIEALCRPLGVGILISQDLLGRLPRLPAGVRARSLGAHALRGRGAPLSVATLERGPPTSRRSRIWRRAGRGGRLMARTGTAHATDIGSSSSWPCVSAFRCSGSSSSAARCCCSVGGDIAHWQFALGILLMLAGFTSKLVPRP